jgi:uncharacterized protein (DUF433 family)
MSDHIVKTEGVCGGKPRIRDRRVRVQDVAYYSEWCDWTPDQIAAELELTLAQVHAALSYYFDNIDEIRQDVRRGDAIREQLASQTPSKVADKLSQRAVPKIA